METHYETQQFRANPIQEKIYDRLYRLKSDLSNEWYNREQRSKELSWWHRERKKWLYWDNERGYDFNLFADEIRTNSFNLSDPKTNIYFIQLAELLTQVVQPLRQIVLEEREGLNNRKPFSLKAPNRLYVFPSVCKWDNSVAAEFKRISTENKVFIISYDDLLHNLENDLSVIANCISLYTPGSKAITENIAFDSYLQDGAFTNSFPEQLESSPVPIVALTAEVTVNDGDSNESIITIESFIAEPYHSKLIPYLKIRFENKKQKAIVPMLYALNELKCLVNDICKCELKNLHAALTAFLGDIGQYSGFCDAIKKYEQKSIDESMDETKRQKIRNEKILINKELSRE